MQVPPENKTSKQHYFIHQNAEPAFFLLERQKDFSNCILTQYFLPEDEDMSNNIQDDIVRHVFKFLYKFVVYNKTR